MKGDYALATFAGGCFWCLKDAFEELNGVQSVTAGFTGGTMENPTYEDVRSGETGHCEAVQIIYQSPAVSYKILLQTYWRRIDPTDEGGQFSDRGSAYRTAIFYHTEEQKLLALESKNALQNSALFSSKIVTEVLPLSIFYVADDYQQTFAKKNNFFYCQYRKESGRDDFIKKIWDSDA